MMVYDMPDALSGSSQIGGRPATLVQLIENECYRFRRNLIKRQGQMLRFVQFHPENAIFQRWDQRSLLLDGESLPASSSLSFPRYRGNRT